MGPAPSGTTAALPASAVACPHEGLGGCGAGGPIEAVALVCRSRAASGCRRVPTCRSSGRFR